MGDIIFPFHMLALALAAWGIFLADKDAFAWFTGKKLTLERTKVDKYHRIVLWGLGLLIVTGFFLFWPAREFLLQRTSFLVKMFFVVVLIINSFVIAKFAPIAVERTYQSLSAKEKSPLIISGAVSAISWAGAIISAFFLFG